MVKNANNDHKTLLERPKSEKNGNKKCRNHMEQRKVASFGIQNGKTQPLFKISAGNFEHSFNDNCNFTHIPVSEIKT